MPGGSGKPSQEGLGKGGDAVPRLAYGSVIGVGSTSVHFYHLAQLLDPSLPAGAGSFLLVKHVN